MASYTHSAKQLQKPVAGFGFSGVFPAVHEEKLGNSMTYGYDLRRTKNNKLATDLDDI
ncbi:MULTISPECIES: hypothetical protein [Shewanella]|uniref:hypothetical protein n=1 Tax=Shewanella TaxID=22 RepID=UPI001C658A47|nr:MULTISPECIES: hypothetical protein [Shewanella]QYJ74412.1 hypothetical protein K0H79_13745 [Shewanella sp. FJAT-52076]QYK04283.1 hypothetical protein K0H63_14585 [Shewanella zhangzhouensis]